MARRVPRLRMLTLLAGVLVVGLPSISARASAQVCTNEQDAAQRFCVTVDALGVSTTVARAPFGVDLEATNTTPAFQSNMSNEDNWLDHMTLTLPGAWRHSRGSPRRPTSPTISSWRERTGARPGRTTRSPRARPGTGSRW